MIKAADKNPKVLLVALLLFGISFLSIVGYSVAAKKRVAILENEKQGLAQELETERSAKQMLTRENLILHDGLKASKDELIRLEADLQQRQKNIEELSSQISALKVRNIALKEEKDKLELELSQISKERDILHSRLGSIVELKKAIKALRIQMRGVGREARKKAKELRVITGNRGFLIKDGQPTFPARVRIEVRPVSAGE